MFTLTALPIDRFLPGPTRARRLTGLFVALAAALALGLGSASNASAAVALSVSTPAFSSAGGSHVEATAYSTWYGRSTLVESSLYQYYGGAWHLVDTGTSTTSNGSSSAKAFVRCAGALTGYYFQSRARSWTWNGSGWTALATTWSPVVIRPC